MKAESGRTISFFLTVSVLVAVMLYLTIESAGNTVVLVFFVIALLILLEAVDRTQKLGWKGV